jgi:uncharacterized protein YuzE
MKLEHDPKFDALYVRFGHGAVESSQEVSPGIIFDYDAKGRIVAIEVLDARQKLAPDAFPIAAE